MTVDDPQEANDSRVVERTRPVELPGGAAPLAAWLFVFLVVRLFAISGYNWDTAFLVSTTLGLDDGLRILFGSFMTGRLVGAPLLVVMLPLLVAAFLWSPSGRRPTVVLLAGLAISALLSLTMSFRAWWLLPITAAVFGALVLVRQLRLDSFPRRALTAAIERLGWILAAGMLLVALLTQTPWVPRERIETTNGTVTGYVLSIDPGYLNVLTEDHEFVIILSGDVLSRS